MRAARAEQPRRAVDRRPPDCIRGGTMTPRTTFLVMGLAALLGALDPVARRGPLRLIGLLWLGACAGRLLGVYLDGNPGLPGWGAVGFELLVGAALVVAAGRAPVVLHEAPLVAAAPPP
ncbi:MAG: DUF4345 domain-containing protein [Deltaproteobacteria bacterium]|nr:MAG: DUF4345 domain-containing protein [Deltaproteobacteria bacterium]